MTAHVRSPMYSLTPLCLQVKLSESVVSMPAELARKETVLRIQPNRERIRQILATASVLELQRQLLTTVMENEVSHHRHHHHHHRRHRHHHHHQYHKYHHRHYYHHY